MSLLWPVLRGMAGAPGSPPLPSSRRRTTPIPELGKLLWRVGDAVAEDVPLVRNHAEIGRRGRSAGDCRREDRTTCGEGRSHRKDSTHKQPHRS